MLSYSIDHLATDSFPRLPRAKGFSTRVLSRRLTGWPAVVLSVPSRLAASALPKAPAATTVDSTPLVPLACRVSLASTTAGVAVRLRASNAVPLTTAPAGQQPGGAVVEGHVWHDHDHSDMSDMKPAALPAIKHAAALCSCRAMGCFVAGQAVPGRLSRAHAPPSPVRRHPPADSSSDPDTSCHHSRGMRRSLSAYW